MSGTYKTPPRARGTLGGMTAPTTTDAPVRFPTKIAVLRVRRKDGRTSTPAEALPE